MLYFHCVGYLESPYSVINKANVKSLSIPYEVAIEEESEPASIEGNEYTTKKALKQRKSLPRTFHWIWYLKKKRKSMAIPLELTENMKFIKIITAKWSKKSLLLIMTISATINKKRCPTPQKTNVFFQPCLASFYFRVYKKASYVLIYDFSSSFPIN